MEKADLTFFIDPSRCIGCQACVHACSECETHKGQSMIHLEFVDRPLSTQNDTGRLHALRFADLRRCLPGRRHQAIGRRSGHDGQETALHRLLQLRIGLPVRRAEDDGRVGSDDEVRHVLRSHFGRPEADVPPRCVLAVPCIM